VPERAVAWEAALDVAAGLGLRAEHPVVLADRNNTIIRLGSIVAKVGTSHFRDARLESLQRELAVSAHLAARGAPVIPPARDLPPGPHQSRGMTVTLWEYVEPVPDAAPAPSELAAAIKLVHEALGSFAGSLPRFDLELEDAKALLHPDRSPALQAEDRRFLLSVIAELEATLPPGGSPLHGSPHADNWLMSADGPLLLDFETACRGPVEWDLTTLGDDVHAFFPDADRELISSLGRMRSVCVAAKCWVAPERAPQLREAAEVHLKLLRGERVD
jgi:Phosphotransferase enzyme family